MGTLVIDIFLLVMTLSFYYFTQKAAWTIELLSGLFFTLKMMRMIYLLCSPRKTDILSEIASILLPNVTTMFSLVFLTSSNYVMTQYFILSISSLAQAITIPIIESKKSPVNEK